jgi:hypothetical protein
MGKHAVGCVEYCYLELNDAMCHVQQITDCPFTGYLSRPDQFMPCRGIHNRLLFGWWSHAQVASDEDGSVVLTCPHVSAGYLYPEEVSACVLSALLEDAAAATGAGTISKAVITVPAYFSDEQREATITAGEPWDGVHRCSRQGHQGMGLQTMTSAGLWEVMVCLNMCCWRIAVCQCCPRMCLYCSLCSSTPHSLLPCPAASIATAHLLPCTPCRPAGWAGGGAPHT